MTLLQWLRNNYLLQRNSLTHFNALKPETLRSILRCASWRVDLSVTHFVTVEPDIAALLRVTPTNASISALPFSKTVEPDCAALGCTTRYWRFWARDVSPPPSHPSQALDFLNVFEPEVLRSTLRCRFRRFQSQRHMGQMLSDSFVRVTDLSTYCRFLYSLWYHEDPFEGSPSPDLKRVSFIWVCSY